MSDSLESDRPSIDGNSLPAKEASDHVSAAASIQPVEEHEGLEGIRYVRQVLAAIQERHQASREAAKQSPVQAQQRKQKDTRVAQTQRMQQYWASGDPILMAEAQRWAIAHPGVLQGEQPPLPLMGQPHLAVPPRNLAELLAAIAVQIQRLQWTPEQVSDRLGVLFGKHRQAQLDDLELAQWRLWLEAQVTASHGEASDG